MKISLDEMATFVEVVNSGSFSRASQLSGVPVSTVSRRISDLERRLQVQLLHRTTRKQSLTDIGAVYFEHCARMLQEAEAAELAVQNLQAEPSGVLRMTTPFPLDDSFSSNLVLSFAHKYPKMHLECIVSRRKIDLIEEKYDCAFIPGALEDSSLITRGMGTFQLIYCASPGYLEQYGRPEQIEDLAKHNLISFQLPDWLNLPPDPYQSDDLPRFSTNDQFLSRRMGIDGLGIIRIPKIVVNENLRKGELTEILEPYRVSVPLNLVFPGNKQLTTKLRAFIDHMIAYSTEHAPWEFR